MDSTDKTVTEIDKIYGQDLMERGYTIMPELVELTYPRIGVTLSEFALIRRLCSRWWKKPGLPMPSVPTLAKELNLSKREVQYLLSSLKGKNCLITYPRFKEHRRWTNMYDLNPFLKQIREYIHTHPEDYYSIPTVLTFDAAGTILDFDTAMQEALKLILQDIHTCIHTPQAQALTTADLHSTYQATAKAASSREMTDEQMRYHAFEQILLSLGYENAKFADRLTKLFFVERAKAIRPYEDVLSMLLTLKSVYRLGLVANHPIKLAEYGLADIFDFTFFAREHKLSKKDPEFYQHMLSYGNAKWYQVVHVTSSLDGDVARAQALKLRAVWLNRHNVSKQQKVKPFAEIRSLEGLWGVLGTDEAGP